MSAPVAAPATVPPPTAGAPGAPGQQQVVYYVYQMQAPGASTEGQAMDWSVCFTFYFLRTALNFLNIASWVIFLAGICKAQANCNSGKFDSGLGYPFPGAGWGQGPNYLTGPYNLSSGDCGTIYGLTWWSVWLQFAAVVVATITSISMFTKSKTVRSIFTTTMYFFIMSSVLLFFIANQYITETWVLNKRIDDNNNSWNSWIAATTLLSVGAIASLICNFIWIVWNSYGDIPAAAGSGAAPAPAAHDGDAFVAPADDKHAAPAAATTTPTVTVASA